MDASRSSHFLDPSTMATLNKQKAEAIRLAKEQAAAVKEMCRRAKTDQPPYEFEELIGKGAYGRVYKGRQLPSRKLVAIKVMEIDTLDYRTVRDMKDESINDFIRETKVMKQVKDAGAKNINMLIEAISIHSQLWLVCEHCPGGSVKTLMRATGDKLEEKFIIPIARELAVGLKAIHDAGIIHRDIKAANILIHEEGRLEICDFGVAGVLQSKLDKRSTWIGTPHWMPPEMFSNKGGEAHQYGSEIDVWAFGCTLHEFATGNPPNAGLRERMQIGRQLVRITPKLEGGDFSPDLKEIVSFALNSDPITRPTMGDILKHPYIVNSAVYPTSSLSELVRNYYHWAQRGGQRVSLFNPGGAVAAEFPGGHDKLDEDWNFSTTDHFEQRFSIDNFDTLSISFAGLEEQMNPTPKSDRETIDDLIGTEMTPEQKANFDERVKRGAAAMEGLFNEDKPTYKYETKTDFVPVEQKQRYSDLPLRTVTDRSSVTSTFIDINLGAFDSSHYAAGSVLSNSFQLADPDTIRANRSSLRSARSSSEEHFRSRFSDSGSSDSQEGVVYRPKSGTRPPTMDWKFPTVMQSLIDNEESEIPEENTEEAITQTDKRATRDWTFPVMIPDSEEQQDMDKTPDAEDNNSQTIKPLQLNQSSIGRSHGGKSSSFDSITDSRPSTATSAVSATSDYDPFRFDRPPTPPGQVTSQHGHFYDNVIPGVIDSTGYKDYEPSSVLDGPGPDHEDGHPAWQDTVTITDPSAYVGSFASSNGLKQDDPILSPSAAIASPPAPQSISSGTRKQGSTIRDSNPMTFPDIQPPSIESLTAGAGDPVLVSELDRLLGNFLDALTVTAEALNSVEVESRPVARRRKASTDAGPPE